MLGDSVFKNLWFIVSFYCKPANANLSHDQDIFNDAMKSPRVISEHCIGILKGRFPFLRQIRMPIKDDRKKSIKRICKYVEAAVILHNLLVKRNDEIPEHWIDDDDRSDMFDEDRQIGEKELAELNAAVPEGATHDERREQLCRFHNNHHIIG